MKKILLIEDDQAQRSMYQTLLTNHGFDVFAAPDGPQGLKKALEIHPDCILLDIRLPGMDGMALMHELRKDPWGKSVKIIILTAYDTDDKILEGVTTDDPSFYLMKSQYRPEGVLEKINELLAEKQPNQEPE